MNARGWMIAAALAAVCSGPAGLSHAGGTGDEPEAVFARANALFKQGEYAQAIEHYERLAASGYVSAGLYYNLGNAHFRARDTGRAALNYERALLLSPGDKEVLADYALVRGREGLPVPSLYGSRVIVLLDRAAARLGADVLAAAFFAAFLLFLGALGLRLFVRGERTKKSLSAACAACGLIVVCAGVLLFLRARSIQRAAVAVREVSATFAPLENATAHFTLLPGAMVEVLDCSSGYCRVRRADGRTGWVRSDSVQKIR